MAHSAVINRHHQTTGYPAFQYLDAFFGGGPDLIAVRALLTDNFTFQGPLMTASNADDFITQLKGMGPEGRISFSEWYWIRNNKIDTIKLHYDPRPLLAAMGTVP